MHHNRNKLIAASMFGLQFATVSCTSYQSPGKVEYATASNLAYGDLTAYPGSDRAACGIYLGSIAIEIKKPTTGDGDPVFIGIRDDYEEGGYEAGVVARYHGDKLELTASDDAPGTSTLLLPGYHSFYRQVDDTGTFYPIRLNAVESSTGSTVELECRD